MNQQLLSRRKYLTLVGVGLLGSAAGCGQGTGTTENTGSNDIVIWVQNRDIAATITVENSSTEEVLFEEAETFSELLYPEDGPNARYEDVFGTETVKVTFDVQNGPKSGQKFSDREASEIHITYDGSIEFKLTSGSGI